MKKVTVLTSLIILVLSVRSVEAQPAFDSISPPLQEQTRQEQSTPSSIPTTPAVQPQTTRQETIDYVPLQQQGTKTPPSAQPITSLNELNNRLSDLERKIPTLNDDPQVAGWLGAWWQIGFWSSILLLFPWVFVGWQWAKLKFWGFIWPWPWWFWIPLIWFFPWIIIGWLWWSVWWVWWVWIWWLFPWIFWLFWWVILFKEMAIAQWHRRTGSVTTE